MVFGRFFLWVFGLVPSPREPILESVFLWRACEARSGGTVGALIQETLFDPGGSHEILSISVVFWSFSLGSRPGVLPSLEPIHRVCISVAVFLTTRSPLSL